MKGSWRIYSPHVQFEGNPSTQWIKGVTKYDPPNEVRGPNIREIDYDRGGNLEIVRTTEIVARRVPEAS